MMDESGIASRSTMMSIEERLAKIEEELAELKRRLSEPSQQTAWYWKVAGSMAAYPEFQEVVRLGREFRKADSPTGSQESS